MILLSYVAYLFYNVPALFYYSQHIL